MIPDPSQPPPQISVVIATCSRASLLAQVLESLLPQLPPLSAELIVVDDGSTDSTPQLLAAHQLSSPVPITIISGELRGVAAARNLAAHHARAPWLASFDDDQIALPNWLAALATAAQETGASCIGGSLLLSLPPGHTLASLGPRTRSILGEHHPCPTLQPYPLGIRPATNNVLLRRDLFLQLNGYDPTFTEGAEDADFFDRAQASGHTLWFQPAAQALHLIPASRLQPANLRWTSLRIGAGDARLQHRRRPILGPFRLAATRLAVTLLRDLPLLAWSTLRPHPAAAPPEALEASPTPDLPAATHPPHTSAIPTSPAIPATSDTPAALDTRCSLWYTQGLLRALPAILLARPHDPFLRSLNFRTRNGERPPVNNLSNGHGN